jgi:isopentenyl-diphosphate delta-isomerase
MIGYYNEDPVLILRKSKIGNGWASIIKARYDCFLSSTRFGFKIIFDEFYHYLEDHKI